MSSFSDPKAGLDYVQNERLRHAAFNEYARAIREHDAGLVSVVRESTDLDAIKTAVYSPLGWLWHVLYSSGDSYANIATSHDGVDWVTSNPHGVDLSHFTSAECGAVSDGGVIVFGSEGASRTDRIFRVVDPGVGSRASTGTVVNTATATTGVKDLAWTGVNFVSVLSDGTVEYSPDGSSWTVGSAGLLTPNLTPKLAVGVVPDGGSHAPVVAWDSGSTVTQFGVSTDGGVTWSLVTVPSGQYCGVGYDRGTGLWHAVSVTSGSLLVARSSDANAGSWGTALTSSPFGSKNGNDFKIAGSRWLLALTTSSYLVESVDHGATWRPIAREPSTIRVGGARDANFLASIPGGLVAGVRY